MRKALFIILLVLISGCETGSPKEPAKPMALTEPASQSPKVGNINFEISTFTIDYKDNTGINSEYVSEKFAGNGIINAIGDENLVKKPYLVLIDVKKVSGGANNIYFEGPQNVIVRNGIGKFSTDDSQFQKNATRLTKPVYDIKIIGYLPYNEMPNKTSP